jgi:hypothetical protein
MLQSMRKVFGEYKESEHRRMVGEMVKSGKLFSRSGRSRMNDDEIVSPKPIGTAGGKT